MKKFLAVILAFTMLLSSIIMASAACEEHVFKDGTCTVCGFNEPVNPFGDVSEDAWYYNEVVSAVSTGIINGKTATEFKPDDLLTYAEAIKLAACMSQVYLNGNVTLTSGDPWYQPYVDYCRINNIITKNYDFEAYATRTGYMEIFAKALPDTALEKINNIPDGSILDIEKNSPYAIYVYKMYRAGIVAGVDELHNCDPDAYIKRCEVATIISRMMDADKRVKFDMGEEVVEETIKDDIIENQKTENTANEAEDVTSEESSDTASIIGCVIETGIKDFTENDETTRQNYVKVLLIDGTTADYKTKIISDGYKDSIVRINFEDGYAKIKTLNRKKDLNGIFSYKDMTIGKHVVSPDVKILDVYSTNDNEILVCTTVQPQRIDGVSFSTYNVIYYTKNNNGEIKELILDNVTGDMLKYGLMTNYIEGTTDYDLEGTVYDGETLNLIDEDIPGVGTPIKVVFKNEEALLIQPLQKTKDRLHELTPTSATIGKNIYPVSPDVCVYLDISNNKFLTMTISDLIDNLDKYYVSSYYDKEPRLGGRIRVIVATKK